MNQCTCSMMWLQSSALPSDLMCFSVLQDKVFLWKRAVCSVEVDYWGVGGGSIQY